MYSFASLTPVPQSIVTLSELSAVRESRTQAIKEIFPLRSPTFFQFIGHKRQQQRKKMRI